MVGNNYIAYVGTGGRSGLIALTLNITQVYLGTYVHFRNLTHTLTDIFGIDPTKIINIIYMGAGVTW